MLKYVPRQLREKLQQNNINSINQLVESKSNKYKQTLKFMTEWSNDLLQREHQLHNLQQKMTSSLADLSTKSKIYRNQSQNDKAKPSFDIQRIVQQELIRKVQDVYAKQILLYETTQPLERTFTQSQQCSIQDAEHIDQRQLFGSKSSHGSKNLHHKLSSNFQNYFNAYECNTDSKNSLDSQSQQMMSQASNLIQQQYNSNEIYQKHQNDCSQSEINQQQYDTYKENFISF